MFQSANDGKLLYAVTCNCCGAVAKYRSRNVGCINLGEVQAQTEYQPILSVAFTEPTGWVCSVCAPCVRKEAIKLAQWLGLKEVKLSTLMRLE